MEHKLNEQYLLEVIEIIDSQHIKVQDKDYNIHIICVENSKDFVINEILIRSTSPSEDIEDFSNVLPESISNKYPISEILEIIQSENNLNQLRKIRENLSQNLIKKLLSECLDLRKLEHFDNLFYIIKAEEDPDLWIEFLLNTVDNSAAKYELYLFYLEAKHQGQIRTNSFYEVLKLASVRKTAQRLSNGNVIDRYISKLIFNDILDYGRPIDPKFLDSVQENGYDGFLSYISSLESKDTKKVYSKDKSIVIPTKKQNPNKNINSTTEREEFKFIKELDNHYLLLHKESEEYALLPKDLATVPLTPDSLKPIMAYIEKSYENPSVLFLYQEKPAKGYVQPPLINVNRMITITRIMKDGAWVTSATEYTNFLKIKIVNPGVLQNINSTYSALVRSQGKNYFTYNVVVL